MDVVNLINNINTEFGMLVKSTWGGRIYEYVDESNEVCFF